MKKPGVTHYTGISSGHPLYQSCSTELILGQVVREDIAKNENEAKNKGIFISILNSIVKNVEPNIRLMFDRQYGGHYTSPALQN